MSESKLTAGLVELVIAGVLIIKFELVNVVCNTNDCEASTVANPTKFENLSSLTKNTDGEYTVYIPTN